MTFKTLDDLPEDLTGKRVLVRVDLNVPMDGRRGHRRHAAAGRCCRPLPSSATAAPSCCCCRISGGPRGEARPGHVDRAAGAAAPSRCSAGRCASSRIAPGPEAERAVTTMLRAISACSRTRASTPARRRTIPSWPRRWPRSAIFMSTMLSRPRIGRMPRPKASRISCRALPAARWRRSWTRSNARSAIRSGRSRRWSAGPRSRPSSPCSGIWSSKVDHLIIGGGMANTFLAARGVNVGKSLCEHELTGEAERDLRRAPKQAGCTIHLPYDVVVAKEFAPNPPSVRTFNVHEVAARRDDPRRRPGRGRGARRRAQDLPHAWSGTDRSARSKCRRSTPRRWRSRRLPRR